MDVDLYDLEPEERKHVKTRREACSNRCRPWKPTTPSCLRAAVFTRTSSDTWLHDEAVTDVDAWRCGRIRTRLLYYDA